MGLGPAATLWWGYGEAMVGPRWGYGNGIEGPYRAAKDETNAPLSANPTIPAQRDATPASPHPTRVFNLIKTFIARARPRRRVW